MNCTSCGATNPEGARFCERCGVPLSSVPMQSPSGSDSSSSQSRATILAGRKVWIVVAVSAVLILVAVMASLNLFGSPHSTPEGTVLSWLFAGSFGNANGMADRTVASAIGGTVYNNTLQEYSDLLTSHHGYTRVSVSTIIEVEDRNLTPTQRQASEDAMSQLSQDYGLVFTDFTYVRFHLTGLGHYNQEST